MVERSTYSFPKGEWYSNNFGGSRPQGPPQDPPLLPVIVLSYMGSAGNGPERPPPSPPPRRSCSTGAGSCYSASDMAGVLVPLPSPAASGTALPSPAASGAGWEQVWGSGLD